ncbi:putative transporter C22E12.01 [Verticillium dahliae VDG2]|nr:putative transporter C22E12.01 [Verticillium dahliae VDG2]
MSSESQLQTWSYLRQQISDNLNFSCPPDAQISVVTSRDPAAKVWHALAVQARNNCKTVVLIDQGSSVELALKGLFIKSAYHVHRHLSLKKTSKVSPPTPSGRPPAATRQPEEPAYDSSSDDSDWEELKLQANITRAKNFLNRSSAHGARGLALSSRATVTAAPPPRFTTHPRVPPLIPPLLPVRLAINTAANNEAAPLNVLTTISRPTRRALLIGAIACVGQQDTSGYRAKARRAHLDGVACDMALFAADDLSFFFGKETVPFFEVEVWRESSTEQLNSDADGDDDEDEA